MKMLVVVLWVTSVYSLMEFRGSGPGWDLFSFTAFAVLSFLVAMAIRGTGTTD